MNMKNNANLVQARIDRAIKEGGGTTMLLTPLWLRDLFLGFRRNMNSEEF